MTDRPVELEREWNEMNQERVRVAQENYVYRQENDALKARIQELEGSVAGKDVQIEQLKSDLRLGVVRDLDELRAENERLKGLLNSVWQEGCQRNMSEETYDGIEAVLKTTQAEGE